MCGIFGYQVNLDIVRRAILATNLARSNDGRGGDSWGRVAIAGNSVSIARGLGKMGPVSLELAEHGTLFGHTRLKTTGKISIANAHPFEIGALIGAHNGMISNYWALNEKYKRSHAVDSMHIFSHLDAGLPFDELRGYGAIEWIERANPDKIYLCRLANGTSAGALSVHGIGTGLDDVSGVIWSSDADHLRQAVAAADIETFVYKVPEGEVMFVQDGKLFVQTRKLVLGDSVNSYKPRGRDEHDEDSWLRRVKEQRNATHCERRSSANGRWMKGEKGSVFVENAETKHPLCDHLRDDTWMDRGGAVCKYCYACDPGQKMLTSLPANDAAPQCAHKNPDGSDRPTWDVARDKEMIVRARVCVMCVNEIQSAEESIVSASPASDGTALWPEKDVWEEYQEQARNEATAPESPIAFDAELFNAWLTEQTKMAD